MKRLLQLIALLLCQIAATAQNGETTYTLTFQSKPEGSCSMNYRIDNGKSQAYNNADKPQIVAGQKVKLELSATTGCIFDHLVSADTIMDSRQEYIAAMGRNGQVAEFIMPAHDVSITAVTSYDPELPDHPGESGWDPETGALVITSFTPGSLGDAIRTAITDKNGRTTGEVRRLTVAGKALTNDLTYTNSLKSLEYLDFSRTTSISEVQIGTFRNNTMLKTVLLPVSITTIGEGAFEGCSALESFTCFATTPPQLDKYDGKYPFYGCSPSLIVYVPAESLPLYAVADGWKDMELMPITQGIHTLTVNMPAGANMQQYKDMFLELVNTKTSQTRRYVLTSRTQYTFTNLIEGTQYNIYLKNAREDILGSILGIDIDKSDVQVTFAGLEQPRGITLRLVLPNGSPADESAFTTTWTDAVGNYIATGTTLTGQMEGAKVIAKVKLGEALGTQYLQPADTLFSVGQSTALAITLTPLPQTTLSGTVTAAATGSPIHGASIAVTQQLNGLYPVTLTTTTDAQGRWTLTAFDAIVGGDLQSPTEITAQADGYVPQKASLEASQGGTVDFALPDLTGTSLLLDFTYTPATPVGDNISPTTEPAADATFSGFDNISYTVYDETHGEDMNDIVVQGQHLVLQGRDLAPGTKLRITATSPSNLFMPVTATCTVNESGQATATLPITELGQLRASFAQTDNQAVVGMLYKGNGQLLGSFNYEEAKLSLINLPDDRYTLVTMGASRLFNGAQSLDALQEMRLEEGRDYISNEIAIQSGRIDSLHNQLIPSFDESVFYHTTEDTHFTANKSSLTVGNYVTLRTQLDFKAGVTPHDVQLFFDLPEGCSLVEGSVMAGNSLAQYEVDDRRVTVPLNSVADVVRFCVVPTKDGYYEPTAAVSFNNGGTVVQPLGSVAFTAEALSINVPERVSRDRVQVSGTAIADSQVYIYGDGQLIGHTESGPDGSWSMRCSLNRPYNLSQHEVYAVVTTAEGINLQTETATVTVSQGTVTPVVHAQPGGMQYEIEWDFRDYSVNPKHCAWPLGPGILPFTFSVDFYNEDNHLVNDTTLISNVVLYVLLSDDSYVELKTDYNDTSRKWIAQNDFSIDCTPKNIYVDFLQDETILADREQMDDEVEEILERLTETRQMVKDIYALPNKKMVLDNQAVFDELEQLLAIEEPDSDTQVRIDVLLGILTDGMSITLDNQADYDELAQLMASLPERETTAETKARIETLMERIKNAPKPDLSGLNSQIASINAKKYERRDDILTLFSMVANIDTTTTQKPNGDFSFDIHLKDKVLHYSAKHIGAINTDALIAEGYNEVPMTDGKSIYCMMPPNKESLIDPRSNMQYTIVTEDAPAASHANAPIHLRVDSLFDQQLKAEFIENVNDLILVINALHGSNFSENLLKEYVFGRGYPNVGAIQYYASRLLDSGRKNMDEMAESLYKQYKDIYELDKYNNKINIEEAKKALATAKEKRSNAKKHRDDVKGHIETLKIYIDNDRKNNYPEDRIAKLESELNYWQTQLLPRAEAELTQANNMVEEAKNTLENAKENEKLTESLCKENEKSKKAIDAIVKSLPSTYTYGGRQQKWIAKAHELEGTPLGLLLQLYELYFQSQDAYNEIGGWKKTYEAIKAKYPCPDMEIEQKQLENKIIYLAQANGKTAIESSTGGASMIANADFVPHGDTRLSWFLTNCTGVSIGYWFNVASSEAMRKEMDAAIDALKCEPDPDEEPVYQYTGSYYLHGDPSDPSKNKNGKKKRRYSSSTNIDFYHDPSGFVYEAVESNRLEGVIATCYYKEEVEDMYGDLHENVVLWNAEEYAQENPLFTDVEGKYRWDVPQGLWQVKYEKEGYETAYSEWLPVPPPQLEVNIGMTQLRQPAVQQVKACTDGIDITFDKYMSPATLTTENIFVSKGGQTVGGKIELLNADSGYQLPDQQYASKVRFVPATPLTLTDNVRLTVRRQVESYAGLQMEQDFTQEFDVEQRITAIVADSLLYMAEGDTQVLSIQVLPAEAAKGKQMKAVSLNEDVVIVGNNSPAVTLDQNGRATLDVFAASLGSSAIKIYLTDDDELQATTLVLVKDPANMFVYMPKASRMSGTEVYRGAEIKLTCKTAGATILYTLDGSCPCDTQSPSVLTYNAPIVATGTELVIRAMAVANGMAESDVAEFRYKVIDNIVPVEPVVQSPTPKLTKETYYRLDGRQTDKLQRGFNIVRRTDGTTQKVVVK